MADLLNESKRYLEARLKECETKPELNRFQIAEYKKYLEMLSSSKDANDYSDKIAFSGDMFSISRAEQLDRYNNMSRLKNAFGDVKSSEAVKICLDAAAASKSHTDLYDKMQTATVKSNESMNVMQQARNQVSTLIQCLITYHICCKSKKASAKKAVKDAWEGLKKLDPEITWDRMTAYPPFRSIMIFDENRMNVLKTWFKEVVS